MENWVVGEQTPTTAMKGFVAGGRHRLQKKKAKA